MSWTDPQYVTSGEASATQFNAETVDNLLYLKAQLDVMSRGVVGTPVYDDSSTQVLTNTMTDLAGLAIAFTAVAGRRYKAACSAHFDQLGAGEFITMQIVYGANIIDHDYPASGTAGGNAKGWCAGVFEPGAGTVTVKVRALAGTPAGGEAWECDPATPTQFWVEDVGLA